MLHRITSCLAQVKEKEPLVHSITNYVTINDCANILLCFGAAPAMCEVKSEVEEFARLIAALYINLGIMTEEQKEASLAAARTASSYGRPIVVDPVACGAISRRTHIVEELMECGSITVIKGNMGEIKSLAGYQGKVRGVDSVDDGDNGIEACMHLANKYNTIVAATGELDIITDGKKVYLVENGSPMMPLISGTGCMAGALVAAAVGACDDYLTAVASALMAINIAGEMAAESLPTALPGSFKVKLFDCMYNLQSRHIIQRGKIQCL
ncbi:MAG TPA: hydroxyethylthiazole kinase [Syntrophomonadaceae bacterium]|jgi:hydroxyethylthiazole kinase|nr:hydroxyethylthiazole kinase [Syntrophomonadaceae bacterium]